MVVLQKYFFWEAKIMAVHSPKKIKSWQFCFKDFFFFFFFFFVEYTFITRIGTHIIEPISRLNLDL